MKPPLSFFVLSFLSITACSGEGRVELARVTGPDILDEGYGKGVSAAFAGQVGESFVVAGGANFPGIPASDGGKKRFYDEIFFLRKEDSGQFCWKVAGRLPKPLAYGMSIPVEDGLLMVGGADENGSGGDVFKISAPDGLPEAERIGSLPFPLEQAAGAFFQNCLFLAGGLSGGEPNSEVLMSDDGGENWRKLSDLPEAMVQPVAFATTEGLWVWGGYNPVTKAALGYGYFLDFGTEEWSRGPEGRTFTGAAAAVGPDGRLYVAGGVDRAVFTSALNLPAGEVRDYMLQEPDYYRFNGELAVFVPGSDGGSWQFLGSDSRLARAGAAMGFYDGSLIFYGGEIKPGIRTPESYVISIDNSL